MSETTTTSTTVAPSKADEKVHGLSDTSEGSKLEEKNYRYDSSEEVEQASEKSVTKLPPHVGAIELWSTIGSETVGKPKNFTITPRVCSFWQKKGACKLGDKCKFSHIPKTGKIIVEKKRGETRPDNVVSTDNAKRSPSDGGPPNGGGSKAGGPSRGGGGSVGPGNDVPNPGAGSAPKAVIKMTNYKDIKSYLLQRKIFVFPSHKMTKEVEKYRLEDQVSFKTNMSENRHACSALYRELAITYVLKVEGAARKTLRVEDFYGSNRNNGLVNSENIDVKVSFVQTADYHIQGDVARCFNKRVQEEEIGCDFGLIEDVYENGSRPLLPQDVKRLCERTIRGAVYIIKRDFIGEAGVDSPDYEEGAWCKLENGKVLFSPSPSEQMYPPHASMDWVIESRSYQGIDIAMVHKTGPYSIYRAGVTDARAIELEPMERVEGMFEKITYRIPFSAYGVKLTTLDWLHDNVCSYLPCKEETALVYTPVFWKKNVIMNIKSLRGTLYDHVNTVVVNEFASDKVMVQLQSRFPRWTSEILKSTVQAILFSGRYDKSIEYENIAYTYSVSEKRLEESRLAKPVDEVPIKKVPIIAGAVVIGLLGVAAAKLSSDKRNTVMSLDYKYWLVRIYETGKWIMQGLWNKTVSLTSVVKKFGIKMIFAFLSIFNPKLLRWIRDTFIFNKARVADNIGEAVKTVKETDFNSAVEVIHDSNRMSSSYLLNVLIAPIIEESARSDPFFSLALTCLEVYKKKSHIPTLLVSMGFHGVMSIMALCGVPAHFRMVIHMYWNFIATYLSKRGLNMSVFGEKELEKINASIRNFETYDATRGITYLPIESALRTSNALPPKEYVLEKRVKESIKVKFNGEDITDYVKFGEMLYEMSTTENGIWLLLSPQVFFCKPANSPVNWWTVVMTRVLKEPYDIPLTSNEEHDLVQVWTKIKNLLIALLDYIYSTKYDIYDVRRIVGKKAQRLVDALDRRNKSGNQIELTKSISVKTDETLPMKEEYPFLRPRAITQFSPTFLGETCPVSREMADILHEVFSIGNLFHIYNYHLKKLIPCTFTFGSGYTAEDLDYWMSEALMMSDAIHFIVAGDDCAILWGPWASVFGFCGENDFSTYEFTQGPHCFILYDAVMNFYVNDKDYIERVMQSFAKAYQGIKNVKGDVIRIKSEIRQRMASGSSDTTNFNSLGNIGSAMHIIQNADFEKDPAYYYTQCGFKCKYKAHDDVNQMTFLKGWWQFDMKGTLRWVPLPGMVLKIGKTKRDPVLIAKNKNRNEANRICAYALASSPGYVPHDYPIFGKWLVTMKKLGTISNIKLYTTFERTFRNSLYVLDRKLAVEAVFKRYGIYEAEILEIERTLDEVTQLSTVVGFEGLRKLLIDYV